MVRTPEARMEEGRPEVDYASCKDDPSKSDSPPTSGTPSTAGEQRQADGERSQLTTVFSVDAGSHLVSYSLQVSPDTTLLSSHPQSQGLSRAGEVTQSPSPSPQPKRKRVSLAKTGEIHTEVYHFLIPRLDVAIGTALNVAWHIHCLYSLVKATLVVFLGNSCATGPRRDHIYRLCTKYQLHTSIPQCHALFYYKTVVSSETAYVQMYNSDV